MNDDQLDGLFLSVVCLAIGIFGGRFNMDKYWRFRFIFLGIFVTALVLYDYFFN